MLRKRNTWGVDEKPKGPLGRIRAYLLQDISKKPIQLNEKEKKLLAVYNKCFTYMATGYERRDVVRLLMVNDRMSESNAHNVITSTLKLYGDIYKSSVWGQKAVERENYIRIAMKAELAAESADAEDKAKLLMVATKNRALASKIAGTFDVMPEKKQTVVLPAILLTENPEALNQPQQIEDTDYEEEEDI